jgi:hypothetical protein
MASLEAWTRVKAARLNDPDLSENQRIILGSSSISDVLDALKQLDNDHLENSRGRKYLQRLRPLISGLRLFEKALDVFANADSKGLLSLIWGSLRIVLSVHRPLLALPFMRPFTRTNP